MGASDPVYDTIGVDYAATRRPDPRIAAQLRQAMGVATTLVNVGAGAGSYEPTDLVTVAVEPSRVMIDQRPPGAAPVVRATAEQLPFAWDRRHFHLRALRSYDLGDRILVADAR
jgi:hypothetical protein